MGIFYVSSSSGVAKMSVFKVPAVSVLTVLLVMVVHLSALVGPTTAKMHYIHWNTSNPIFRIDNTDHIIDVNKHNLPYDFDQVNIICPTYDKSTKDHETEKYIIYNVSKEEYDTCRITTLHPRVITVCNKPYDLMYVTITFRPFSPQPNGLEFSPGVDYYFISTSSSDDLERRIGGRCSSHHMKVVFKVCCDPDKQQQAKPLGDQGGVQRARNGAGIINHNRRGGDADLTVGSNSTLLHNTRHNNNKTSSSSSYSSSITSSSSSHHSTVPKSGRTPSSSTPSTTTTTPANPRRRMPHHHRNSDRGGVGGSGSSSSSYDYTDYAVHKDYPHYVKTTTRKVDTHKYPDPRENEVVKNEALNSSPVPSTSHHLSLWWIMLVLLSTTMMVMGNDVGGESSSSGEDESKKRKRDADSDVEDCRRHENSNFGSTANLCLTYNNNINIQDSDSNNSNLLHHQFVLVPQRQHHSRPTSCSSRQQNQPQQKLQPQQERSGADTLLTSSITAPCSLTVQQSTSRWLQQRRKLSHQINSFRCRSRQAVVTC